MIRTAFAAALVLGCAVMPAVAEYGDRPALETLSGTYASTAPEPWYGGFGTRSFTFADGQWGLVFEHALDPEMALKTFTFRTEGPYEIGEPSPVVAGAFEAVFFEDRKYVTLLTDDPGLVEAFGFAGCGLSLGVEVDISETGCAAWKPVAECREDHDLLAIDERGLYFGVRPADNDMCSPDKRPTALLPAVVRQ
jgi:hypothetical protein